MPLVPSLDPPLVLSSFILSHVLVDFSWQRLVVFYTHGYYGITPPFIVAICNPPCENGGKCTQPGICNCTSGFEGLLCQNGKCKKCVNIHFWSCTIICQVLNFETIGRGSPVSSPRARSSLSCHPVRLWRGFV